MKKLLVAVVALLSVANMAHATSIRRDLRLSLREVPASGPFKAYKLTSIYVWGDGEVIRQECPSAMPGPDCTTKVIARYNSYRMDYINHLIREASEGELVRSSTTARCIVAPSSTDLITANNERLTLYKGHICTSQFINNTAEGKKLIKMLNDLRDQSYSQTDAE